MWIQKSGSRMKFTNSQLETIRQNLFTKLGSNFNITSMSTIKGDFKYFDTLRLKSEKRLKHPISSVRMWDEDHFHCLGPYEWQNPKRYVYNDGKFTQVFKPFACERNESD
jgi:hypothetical protein